MIVTSNKHVSEWAEFSGDEALAAAILDRFLQEAEVLTINGPSYRLRGRLDVVAEKEGEPANNDPPEVALALGRTDIFQSSQTYRIQVH